jgi:hypothetical protein
MSTFIAAHRLGRRDFLRETSRIALAAALPGWLGPRTPFLARRGAAVRVRGRVAIGARGASASPSPSPTAMGGSSW